MDSNTTHHSQISSEVSLETTLASYGTLAPGEMNSNQMDGMVGTWSAGTVRGYLTHASKGAHIGLPALILDPNGDDIPVQIFKSKDLPAYWWRLDEFEGEGYRRVPVTVQTDEGEIMAYLYNVKPSFVASMDK